MTLTPRQFFIEQLLYCLELLPQENRRDIDLLRQILFDAEYGHYLTYGKRFTNHFSFITSSLPTPQNYQGILDDLEDSATINHYLLARGLYLLEPQREAKHVFNDRQIRSMSAAVDNNIGVRAFTIVGWESLTEGDRIRYDMVSFAP